MLNSTKGKVGKGKTFFEEAFGEDEQRFWTILWMPETFIIYRFMFKDNLAKEWEEKFWNLPADLMQQVKDIVALNQFKELDMEQFDEQVRDVLTYYLFTRDEAEAIIRQPPPKKSIFNKTKAINRKSWSFWFAHYLERSR
ncbi:MAG: hypothetical protein ACLU6W_14765 [Lachnospiraceae bacterium]